MSAPRTATGGTHGTQLDDLSLSLASAVLHLGGTLGYGHDLTLGSPAALLRRLVQDYSPAETSREVLEHFVAWPLYKARSKSERLLLTAFTRLTEVEPEDLPPALGEQAGFVHWRSGEEVHLWWARSLTAMRERMIDHCSARVAVGGPLSNFGGRVPGIVEEVLLSLRARQPVFLLGGYGGAAEALFRAVNGEPVSEFDLTWQTLNSAGHGSLFAKLDGALSFTWEGIVEELRAIGLQGLCDLNKLSPEENRRLATTRNTAEILYYVSKGLTSSLAARPARR